MKALHLACAADETYLPHCCAMLHSVFTTTTELPIVVHFTHAPEFDRSKLAMLGAFLAKAGVDLQPVCVSNAALAGLPSTQAYPSVIWQRVLLPRLLPQQDKLLYLDSDLIAMGSLKPLWDLDISGYSLAAVSNPMHEEMSDWPLKIGLPGAEHYFNNGVMLMNLARMRAEASTEKIIAHAHAHPHLLHWPEQCAMNSVLHASRYRLHPRWNLMNNFITYGRGAGLYLEAELQEALDDPQIVHFEGPRQSKPWHYRSRHPFGDAYLRHRQQTPWPLVKLEGRNLSNFIKLHILPATLLEFLRGMRNRFK